MPLDSAIVTQMMPTAIPMVGTLNIEFESLDSDRAVLRLPEQPEYHNHIGGPHAGAMFTLAESASGALLLLNYGDRLGDMTPLAVEATIKYLKVAMGPVTAAATSSRPPSEVLAELDAGQRPEFTVEIAITDEAGEQTGAMSVLWTLRPNRR